MHGSRAHRLSFPSFFLVKSKQTSVSFHLAYQAQTAAQLGDWTVDASPTMPMPLSLSIKSCLSLTLALGRAVIYMPNWIYSRRFSQRPRFLSVGSHTLLLSPASNERAHTITHTWSQRVRWKVIKTLQLLSPDILHYSFSTHNRGHCHITSDPTASGMTG